MRNHSVVNWYRCIMLYSRILNVPNMSFSDIRENKILAKIPKFTVLVYKKLNCNIKNEWLSRQEYIVVMLIGNKSDLEHLRIVSTDEAKSFTGKVALICPSVGINLHVLTVLPVNMGGWGKWTWVSVRQNLFSGFPTRSCLFKPVQLKRRSKNWNFACSKFRYDTFQ